jgi:hypothetical protein
MAVRVEKGRGRGVVSVRLDEGQRRAIARVARARGVSPSDVVRTAVDELLERAATTVLPYDGWSRVLGALKDAPSDLSERTGERLARLLRARAQRSR